jgi:hypothetical protein
MLTSTHLNLCAHNFLEFASQRHDEHRMLCRHRKPEPFVDHHDGLDVTDVDIAAEKD